VQQRLGGQAGERERRDVRGAWRAGHREPRAGDDRGDRGDRRLLETIAQRRDLGLGAGLDGGAGQPGGDAEAGQGRQVLAAAAQPALLTTADPDRVDPRAPRAATARPRPRGPCSLCADTATLSAPSARGRSRESPNPCTASTCKCGRLRSPTGPSSRAMSAIGCCVPSSLFTSINATTAYRDVRAAATASAHTTPFAAGATTSSA
jgi:hypothetical protein